MDYHLDHDVGQVLWHVLDLVLDHDGNQDGSQDAGSFKQLVAD